MQARKSRDDQAEFDIFECLSCGTVVREAQPSPPGSGGDQKGGKAPS
jgi:hypothetical protein